MLQIISKFNYLCYYIRSIDFNLPFIISFDETYYNYIKIKFIYETIHILRLKYYLNHLNLEIVYNLILYK
jgi:hypothetical protein